MATVDFTVTSIGEFRDDSLVLTWEELTTTNADGEPAEKAGYAIRSVQVTGTFGVGGTISLQGSNDGTNYVALNDSQGDAITLTAAGLVDIQELTRYIRPFVSAGDGTTDLDVYVFMKILH